MKHFIAYHHTEKMGRPLHEDDPLSLLTNRPIQHLLHNTLWLITGEGSRPRRYALGSVFQVAEVVDTNEDGFSHRVSGRPEYGHVFQPAIPINEIDWFREVQRITGNFGFGVTEIKDEAIVAGLTRLAEAAGYGQGRKSDDQIKLPEEVAEGVAYHEGSVQRILINRYERDPRAREECIRLHGATCCVCGFDFAKTYGDFMQGFVHVHHTTLLSTVGAAYRADPEHDLRPLCPNCHAVVHRREPPYELEEVRRFLEAQRRQDGRAPLSND